MPQFDPNVWPTQIFWLAVLFALLVWLMAKVALPPITNILEEREVRIEDRLRRAEHLKREAESVAAAYERTIAEARAEAQAMVQRVRDQAQQQESERHAALTASLNQQIEAAERRIAAARNEALGKVADVASDLVGSITEKLIGEAFEKAAIKSTVENVMKEAA
jgi:F-type H+-transporting ATPase subunit b